MTESVLVLTMREGVRVGGLATEVKARFTLVAQGPDVKYTNERQENGKDWVVVHSAVLPNATLETLLHTLGSPVPE